MTRAFLVRHGATAWNEAGRLQGRSGPGLSERGEREADAVARVLSEESVARVVTSPLARARETASVVAAAVDAPVVTDPGWRERSFGRLEGAPSSEAFDEHPRLHPKSAGFDPDAAGDGESARAVVERVRGKWPPEPGTAVVTHETPLRVATALVDGTNPIAALSRPGFSPGDVLAVDEESWWRLATE